jgi:hypothetical protein
VLAAAIAAWLGFGCAETPGQVAAPGANCPDGGVLDGGASDAAAAVPANCPNGVVALSAGINAAPGAGPGSGA